MRRLPGMKTEMTRENEDQFQQSETEKTGDQNDSGRNF